MTRNAMYVMYGTWDKYTGFPLLFCVWLSEVGFCIYPTYEYVGNLVVVSVFLLLDITLERFAQL